MNQYIIKQDKLSGIWMVWDAYGMFVVELHAYKSKAEARAEILNNNF